MSRRVVVVLIALAACSPPTAISSSTSSTSSPAVTSAPATSTTAALTTTTTIATSSTLEQVSGLPFIVSAAGLIGYFMDGHWVPSDLERPVEGGEIYQVIDLEGLVGESVGDEITVCEPAGTPLVELDPPLLVTSEEPSEIAVANANWNLTPRPVGAGASPPADLIAEGVAFIEDRGLADPNPNVAQYLTFDLEGDGTDEELLILNRLPEGLIGNADAYSLVLMRKQLDIEPATLIVAYSQGVADNPYVVSYFVSAVADLNGDDKMELVVDSHYYEGNGTSIFEYRDDDLGLLEVLASGCGA